MGMMDMANQNAMIQAMMWNDLNNKSEKYRNLGEASIDPYAWALQIPDYERPEGYDLGKTIQSTPGFNWLYDTGLEGLERKAASRGMLQSPTVAKEMYDYGTGKLMYPMYQDYMNRLYQNIGLGQNTTMGVGQAGMNMASNVGQGYLQAGQMQEQQDYYNRQQNQGNNWLSTLASGAGLLGGIALSPASGLSNSLIGKALSWKM